MNKILDFITRHLTPVLMKFGEQKHVKSVRNGIMLTIPFIICGSIFLIIPNIPIPGWDTVIAPFSSALLVGVTVTFSALSIIAVIGISYHLAKEFKQNIVVGVLMSIVGFFLLQIETETYTINTGMFAAQGLFTAIICAIVCIEILKFFTKRNLVIRLPESVPPAVAESFASIIPAAFMILLFWFIHIVLNIDINAIINTIFQPFIFALNTLPGILVYIFFMALLWTTGIHGYAVMSALGTPIFLQYLTANAEALMAGEPLPYITAYGFYEMFTCIGGCGCTLGLVLMMLRSKESGYKALGRLAIGPSVFGINEPVIFGFPIIFNPIMSIPFILTPMVLAASTYVLMALNIIGRPVVSLPWTIPPIIGPYLVTGGDWRAVIWSVISIIISALIYYPFLKVSEAQRLKEEREK